MKPVILFLLLVTLGACHDYNEFKKNDPFYDSSYLHGRLLLTDEISGEAGKPLGKKTIRIFNQNDDEDGDFILSAVTNDEGYFRFDNLSQKPLDKSRNQPYKIVYSETIDGKVYKAEYKVISLPQDSVFFEATLSKEQPGVIFTVSDAAGLPLNNVDICLSSSQLPYLAKTCEGSNYTLRSGPRGKVGQFNMAPGKYYVFAKTTINKVVYTDKAEIEISSDKLAAKSLEMKPVAIQPSKNTLNITVSDAGGSPVPHARICLFTSKVVFESDTCNYSNYTALTSLAGNTTFTDLVPNTYYILAELYLNNRRLSARGSIIVENKSDPYTLNLILE